MKTPIVVTSRDPRFGKMILSEHKVQVEFVTNRTRDVIHMIQNSRASKVIVDCEAFSATGLLDLVTRVRFLRDDIEIVGYLSHRTHKYTAIIPALIRLGLSEVILREKK